MQIILESHFLRSAKILPASTKEKLAILIELAKTNPFHRQQIRLLKVAHRKDIYR